MIYFTIRSNLAFSTEMKNNGIFCQQRIKEVRRGRMSSVVIELSDRKDLLLRLSALNNFNFKVFIFKLFPSKQSRAMGNPCTALGKLKYIAP